MKLRQEFKKGKAHGWRWFIYDDDDNGSLVAQTGGVKGLPSKAAAVRECAALLDYYSSTLQDTIRDQRLAINDLRDRLTRDGNASMQLIRGFKSDLHEARRNTRRLGAWCFVLGLVSFALGALVLFSSAAW